MQDVRAVMNTFLSFVSELMSIKFVFDNATSGISQISWIYSIWEKAHGKSLKK